MSAANSSALAVTDLMSKSSLPTFKASAYSANDGGRPLPKRSLKPFSFLQLPLELRLKIYGYVLVHEKQPLRLLKTPRKTQLTTSNHSLAILTTSRQLNTEAYPVFLSGNTFSLNGTTAHYQWLKKLGASGQAALRNVIFAGTSVAHSHPYSQTNFHIFNILAGCPKLSLTIDMHCAQLVSLYHMGTFDYLHGFARASYVLQEDRASKPWCPPHAVKWARYMPAGNSWREIGEEAVQMMLQDFLSVCPEKCLSHRSRRERRSASTLHIVCRYGCLFCLRRMAYDAWQCHI